jgi:hypothetical protein
LQLVECMLTRTTPQPLRSEKAIPLDAAQLEYPLS